MEKGIIFIIGVGRSGTSLLQSILSSHSEICIPPETGFVRGEILYKESYSNKSGAEFLAINEKLKRIIKEIPSNWASTFKDEREFYQSLLEHYCEQKKIIGDKDPRLIEFMAATAQVFTESKFIHLVRDPRDVLLSKKKAAWSRGHPSWYHIFANYMQLKIGEYNGHKLPGQRYKVIIYKDLLGEPTATAKELCQFLGLTFEEEMLHFQEKAKELVAEDEKQWKKETYGPLLKKNTGKWKGKLPNWEVALTELLCQQAFTLGGYSKGKAYSKLSFLEKIKVKTLLYFFRGAGVVYRRYRLRSQKRIIAKKYNIR